MQKEASKVKPGGCKSQWLLTFADRVETYRSKPAAEVLVEYPFVKNVDYVSYVRQHLLRGFAPNELLILPTARIQNKCECRLMLMNSL